MTIEVFSGLSENMRLIYLARSLWCFVLASRSGILCFTTTNTARTASESVSLRAEMGRKWDLST